MVKTLTERTLVWAHRGADAYAPENTLEAFKLAVDMKADGVELDVHLSKDGHIMVIHDEKIDRTSNGQGLVTDYTLEELKLFDFGCKFYKEYKGIKVPTLDEVYELLAPTGLTVNVEIKSADPLINAPLIECAKKYNMQEKVIYSSFNHLQLALIKELDKEVRIAPLYSFNMLNVWNYCTDINAFAAHPKSNQVSLFPEYVENCHKKGIRVHPWTIDTVEEAKYLANSGVDAIITNKPDLIREALGLL